MPAHVLALSRLADIALFISVSDSPASPLWLPSLKVLDGASLTEIVVVEEDEMRCQHGASLTAVEEKEEDDEMRLSTPYCQMSGESLAVSGLHRE